MEQYDGSNLESNGIIQVLLPHHSSLSRDVNTGTQAGQELTQKPWRGDAYRLAQSAFL